MAITNRFGDWLHFEMNSARWPSDQGPRQLNSITSSTTRAITFGYSTNGTNFYCSVYDPVSPDPSGTPVVKYRLYNLAANVPVLGEVQKLRDRGGSTYDSTRFEYTLLDGTNPLLARVISPQGVCSPWPGRP